MDGVPPPDIFLLPHAARPTRANDNHGFDRGITLISAGNDMEELEARSPISHAPSIKARVLLLHQHLDMQVPWEQAKAMNDALRSAGNQAQIDTIGLDHEGFFTLETRTAVYKRMLRFLNEHIGQ